MTNQIIYSNPFIIVFLIGTFFSFLIKHLLEFSDWRARCKNGGTLPQEIKEFVEKNDSASSFFDSEKLEKICKYENAKYFMWIPQSLITLALTLLLVCTGYYPNIFQKVIRLTGFPQGFFSTFFCAVLFLFFAGLPESILSIPFELINEFKIEKKFGFSKMTFKLWLADQVKSLVLSLVLYAILLLAATFVLVKMPNTWWILLTCLIFAFSLIMQVLYPLVIAPMFNKFTPLEDGELKEKITSLMKNIGFKSSGIFIMDASKRSGHSNAYFGGLGKSKRIVLYDTLVKQLTTEELVAVLGHELGHYKLKHIIKRFLALVPIEFIMMFVLFKCAQCHSLYTGFGFAIESAKIEAVQFIGLFLSSIVISSLMELTSPITNFFSRKDEYQADAFSSKTTKNPQALVSALIKLNSENLSELLPSKLYVFWNYSHPTLVERIRALKV